MKTINIDKQTFLELYDQGLNDVELAKHFICNSETIRNRRKTWGLKSNFKYKSKLDLQKLKTYVNYEFSAYDIAKTEKVSTRTVYDQIKKHNLKYSSKLQSKPIALTDRQEEIMIGHLLGDGSLVRPNINARGNIVQSVKNYAYWKYKELENLCTGFKCFTNKTPDKRNNICYVSYGAYLRSNPELNWYYDQFYSTGKKIINEDIMDKFTYLSLAVMFMDDGCKHHNTYSIATHCFDDTSLSIFYDKLLSWGIHASKHSTNSTYIKTRSSDLFKHYIHDHIIDCMKYKLVL